MAQIPGLGAPAAPGGHGGCKPAGGHRPRPLPKDAEPPGRAQQAAPRGRNHGDRRAGPGHSKGQGKQAVEGRRQSPPPPPEEEDGAQHGGPPSPGAYGMAPPPLYGAPRTHGQPPDVGAGQEEWQPPSSDGCYHTETEWDAEDWAYTHVILRHYLRH